MNEKELNQDHTEEALQGRQDSRRGQGTPENRFGRNRAREYNGETTELNQQAPVKPIGFKPRGPRTETEMREAVCRALEAEPELRTASLAVEVHDGVIILRGRVAHARMRALAEDCLDELDYVQVIRNEIEVRVGSRGFPNSGGPSGPVITGDLTIECKNRNPPPDLRFRLHGQRSA
ncbi:MAG: BON domain-containing protein [Proteobacteria bacterium]|nr:MAG: BON domain-containing protein [Pseudomonadota bacterium]